MTQDHIEQTRVFHEQDYKTQGLKAQRNYPNEELCRFMGRNFFSIPRDERSQIKILETGCGSGANLWMLASEGFHAHGLDISQEGIDLCKDRLTSMQLDADFSCASMTDIPYDDHSFDAIIDVFSSHCLELKEKQKYLSEVARLLKKGGHFFSYHPSKGTDAYKNHAPATLIDPCTLNGILREGSAFYKYENSFSFLTPEEYKKMTKDVGLETDYIEKVGRTYRNQQEYFEFVTIACIKS